MITILSRANIVKFYVIPVVNAFTCFWQSIEIQRTIVIFRAIRSLPSVYSMVLRWSVGGRLVVCRVGDWFVFSWIRDGSDRLDKILFTRFTVRLEGVAGITGATIAAR